MKDRAMTSASPTIDTRPVLWAALAATLSGAVSAVSLTPAMAVMERSGLGDLWGLLSAYALSAGVAFGLLGGAVILRIMGLHRRVAGVFLLTSMVGIAAAVYLAILSLDSRGNSLLLPYTLGSPLGALIVAVPLAFLAPLARPWRFVGLASVLPTLWAMAVASIFDAEVAMEVPGLAALYIGWQVIFLTLFASTLRRAA